MVGFLFYGYPMNVKRRRKWTLEDLRAEAMKYPSRAAFAKGSQSAYSVAWNRGCLGDICAHMLISPIYSDVRWNKESAMLEGMKYKSRSEFKRECSGAYCHAKDNGFLDEACSHMPESFRDCAANKIYAIARQCSSKAEFRRINYSAYKWARIRGLMAQACSHIAVRTEWTHDLVMAEAAKHSNRSEFHLACAGAYKHALANGYIEDACRHMERGVCGFDPNKPAVLYCLELDVPGVGLLCKIGITNRTARLRIHGMGIPDHVDARVIAERRFDFGRDARDLEQRLRKQFKAHRYAGPSIMANGNTEVFGRDAIISIGS